MVVIALLTSFRTGKRTLMEIPAIIQAGPLNPTNGAAIQVLNVNPRARV
jgi:hypothetical protein